MDNEHEATSEKVARLFSNAASQANETSDETLRAYAEGRLDPLTRDLLAMRLAEDDALLDRYLETVDLNQSVEGEDESIALFRAVSGGRAAFDVYRRDLPDDAARERAERLYAEFQAPRVAATQGEARKAREPWWRAWSPWVKPQARLGFALAACLVLAAVALFQSRRTGEGGLVAVRSGDPKLQRETFDRILRDRTELGPNDSTGLDSAPRLAFPPPENPGVLTWPESFDFVLPDRGHNGGYEAGIWETQNGEPRRRVRADARTEGERLRLTPMERLDPGARYLVGARPRADDGVAADADRPWRVFRQRLLTDAQAAERKRALTLVRSNLGVATAILIDAGRLAEAAEWLEKSSASVPRGPEVLKKLRLWTEAERRGSSLKIDPGLPTGAIKGEGGYGGFRTPDAVGGSQVRRKDDSEGEMTRLFNAGWRAANRQGGSSEAVESLRPAYEMAERLEHDWGMVRCGGMLIRIFIDMGQPTESARYIDPVLSRVRKMYASRKKTPKRLGDIQLIYSQTCYWGAGIAHSGGRHREALALAIEGERVARECGMDNEIKAILDEKGLLQQEFGDFAGAARTHEDNLAILAKAAVNARDRVWIDQYAHAASNLAFCRARLGDGERAKRLCDAALARSAGFSPTLKAELHSTRALAKVQTGEDRGVEEDALKAINIFRTIHGPDAAKGESGVQTTLGIYYLRKGNPPEAEGRFRRARDLAESVGLPQLVQAAELNLRIAGLILDPDGADAIVPDRRATGAQGAIERHTAATLEILRGNFGAAERHARRAVEIARDAGLRADLPLMLDNLAWAMSQGGKRRESCAVFEEAIRLSDRTVRQASAAAVGIVQQRSLGNVHARYAYTLWRLGRVEEAAAALDAARGLGMRAVQNGGRIGGFVGVGAPARVEPLRRSIDAHPQTLVLQYAMIDADRTLLLVSSAHRPTRGFDLRFGARDLARTMAEWKPSSNPDQLGSETTKESERKSARKMGLGLIGELENTGLLDPRRFPHLVVAGDAPIHEVPFGALVDGGGRRLVERFAVSYVANVVGLERARDAHPAKALSCMSYVGADKENLAVAVRDAAHEVARSVRGTALPTGSGIRATEAVRNLVSSRAALFAGHAGGGQDDPLDASFEVGKGEVGRLKAQDVIRLRLHNDLVVLAGCGTGAGVQAGGDGLLGMAWAFQAAGSRSVVASAWPVNDEATQPLVTGFFRRLSQGAPNDEALRRAEIDVMRSPGRWHPYYWAGFKLVGERLKVRL